MKKFIITEEEKKHIRNLYEQTSTDMYSAMLGYLDLYGDSILNDMPGSGPNNLAVKKEVMIYLEDKRDGKQPKNFSTRECNSLYNTVLKLSKEHSNPQELISAGKNIRTNRFA